jgi:hypothetical protein
MRQKPTQDLPEGGLLDATALAIGALAGSVTVMAASVIPWAVVPIQVTDNSSNRKNRLSRRQKKMAARPRLTFAAI